MSRQRHTLIAVFCTVLALCNISVRASGNDDAGWQTYVDCGYRLILRFPQQWKRDSGYFDRPYFGVERPSPKQHGFFQLMLAGDESTTPEQVCKGSAEHVVRPFGNNPSVRKMKVQGQDACLVWPSPDQGGPWDAMFVVKYPRAVDLDGDKWFLLELDADKDYILAIIKSLRFLSAPGQIPKFSLEIAPADATGPGAATWKTGSRFSTDAPISLRVAMNNNSRRVLHFSLGDPARDYRPMVVAVKPWMPIGMRAPIEMENRSDLHRNIPIALTPGESYQDTVNINELFPLGAGDYTVQFERDLPAELGKGIVVSNTLPIHVIE